MSVGLLQFFIAAADIQWITQIDHILQLVDGWKVGRCPIKHSYVGIFGYFFSPTGIGQQVLECIIDLAASRKCPYAFQLRRLKVDAN
jgi:hypothetical protein